MIELDHSSTSFMLATNQVNGRHNNCHKNKAKHELADLRALALGVKLDQVDVIREILDMLQPSST